MSQQPTSSLPAAQASELEILQLHLRVWEPAAREVFAELPSGSVAFSEPFERPLPANSKHSNGSGTAKRSTVLSGGCTIDLSFMPRWLHRVMHRPLEGAQWGSLTGQLRSVDVAVEISGNRPLTRRPAAGDPPEYEFDQRIAW
jgi:hypothetical protein